MNNHMSNIVFGSELVYVVIILAIFAADFFIMFFFCIICSHPDIFGS